jgi:hypothetical protein
VRLPPANKPWPPLRCALQAALLARGRTVRQAKLFFFAKMAEKALASYERDGWGEFPTQVRGGGWVHAGAMKQQLPSWFYGLMLQHSLAAFNPSHPCPAATHRPTLLPPAAPACRRSTPTAARSAPPPTAAPSCSASTPQVGRWGCKSRPGKSICIITAVRTYQAHYEAMLPWTQHTRLPPSATLSPLPQAPCAARVRWLPRRWRWSACGRPRRRSGAATSSPLRGHRRCGTEGSCPMLACPPLLACSTLFPPYASWPASLPHPIPPPPLHLPDLLSFFFSFFPPRHLHRCVSWS